LSLFFYYFNKKMDIGVKKSSAKTSAYKVWSEDEIDDLKREYELNMSLTQMSLSHMRSKGAIKYRLYYLGLKENKVKKRK
jgi:hypothetical protein